MMHFEKATLAHKDIIFGWLEEPHMKEFWDNSERHRRDILNFMKGREESSAYFGVIFTYWVGFMNQDPFSFILTHPEVDSPATPEPYRSHISKTGTTYGLDFGIGNPAYIGKGLAASAIEDFIDFFIQEIDAEADTFMIDPFFTNPRAIHVYKKAGFQSVAEFTQEGGYFDQKKGVLMVKKVLPKTDA